MGEDWTKIEVELIVKDYFQMLQLELEHKKFNKSEHRRVLTPFLNNREKAVEFKHQNISAVLLKMGLPFIKGYKPLPKYQHILELAVVNYLDKHQLILEPDFKNFSDGIIEAPRNKIDFSKIISSEPDISLVEEREPTYRPIKINYLEKEQSNRNLGELGEKLVLDYERYRLIKAGKNNLADRIEWISKEKGDGTGYDILSKNNNGSDRFIEVKTTKLRKETPIYLTHTEVSFAKSREKHFYLYRVFNFDSSPRIFIKNGPYDSFCTLQPYTFKGLF